MMSHEDLIHRFIQCVIASTGQEHPSSFHIHLRKVIRHHLGSQEWWLLGYDSHLINVLLNIGDDFVLKEQFQVALSCYSEAVFFFHSSPICYIKTAQCQHRMGNVKRANRNCLKAIHLCDNEMTELAELVDMKDIIMMVDILISADELDEALRVCCKIFDKSYSNVTVQTKIKEKIERISEMKELEKEEEEKKSTANEKEFKEASLKKRKKVKREHEKLQKAAAALEPQVKKSTKQLKKEQLAREKEIKEAIEASKKRQEEHLNEKKEERRHNKKETDVPAKKKVNPTQQNIGYDVNAALDVTSSKKGLKNSRTNENNKAIVSHQWQLKSTSSKQLSSTGRGKLSLNDMTTHMDVKLSSGSIVRCVCPKCNSPRAVTSRGTNCHSCHSELKLFYKKVNDSNWREPRQPPMVLGNFMECKHFQQSKRCVKTPCTFAHGSDELEIWDIFRGKTKQRSRKNKSAPKKATMKKSTSCITVFDDDLKTDSRSRTQSSCSNYSMQSAPCYFDTFGSTPVSTGSFSFGNFDSQSVTGSLNGSYQEELSQSSDVFDDLHSESQSSYVPREHSDNGLSSTVNDKKSTLFGDEEVNSGHNNTDTAQLSTEDDGEWIAVTSKGKKTASRKKKIKMVCAVCSNIIETADTPQVVRNSLLCTKCNRIGKPKQQFWDSRSEIYRPLRTKPAGIKNIRMCWHYLRNNDHFMPDCKFAHGDCEKILWEREMEEEKTGKRMLEVTFQENPPPSHLDVALLALKNENLRCMFCILPPFRSKEELQHHNSEPQHQVAVMKKLLESKRESAASSKCRPPAPNVYMGRYKLCRRYERGWCYLNDKCTFAHGEEELLQWIDMFNHQSQQMSQLQQKKLFVESLSQKIRRIMKQRGGVLKDRLPGITLKCSSELSVKLNKTADHMWIFDVRIKTTEQKLLNQVAFLREENLDKFKLLKRPDEGEQTTQCVVLCEEDFIEDNQESAVQFCVKFCSDVFGEFKQELVFDFCGEPYLCQSLTVSVMSAEIRESPRKTVCCQILEWSLENMELVLCPEVIDLEGLREKYYIPNDLPDPSEFKEFTRETYCTDWHQMLFIEEQYIQKEIARCDINNGEMKIVNQYEDTKGTVYMASPGDVFGKILFKELLLMDEICGHLIQRSVSSVIIRLKQTQSDRNKVYECCIKQTTPDSVVVKLNQELCKNNPPQNETVIKVDLKFKFNRLPICEMHQAIDRCHSKTAFLLPVPKSRSNTQQKSISTWHMEKEPNDNQHHAITMILDSNPSPPLLLVGPFGTGKTFTLNLACLSILKKLKGNKVLICTHSNSAADIHLDHLHTKLQQPGNHSDIRPLRIVTCYKRVNTIQSKFWKYCLLNRESNQFQEPTWNDLDTHNVIITTLATSRVLWTFYEQGKLRFTHILIDEAAQALESECIIPLTMADDKTKVVLAGDHLQMGPLVYSKSAWVEERGPRASLLQRLFTLYNKTASEEKSQPGDDEAVKPPHVVMLTENYRCHKDILDFPSARFYGNELVARGDQTGHRFIPALSFYAAHGEDKQLPGSLSYYNYSEAEEIARRIEELLQDWPRNWEESIGVVAPYYDQVQIIRQALRKKRLSRVNVETVENVQGKEFRALFISTVRTALTCLPIKERNPDSQDLDFGFLSDVRLLNTAVTRAQSLLAVVGDPMSLSTLGACSEIWKDYLQRCDQKRGLHGCTLKIVFDYCLRYHVLNPHAKEFTPTPASDPPNRGDGQFYPSTSNMTSENSVCDDDTALSPPIGGPARLISEVKNEIQTNLPNENQATLAKSSVSSHCSPLSVTESLTPEKHVQNSAGSFIQQDENRYSVKSSLKSKVMNLTSDTVGESDRTADAKLQLLTSSTTDFTDMTVSLEGKENRGQSKEEEQINIQDFFRIEDHDEYDEIVKVLVQACKETKSNDESKQNKEETNEEFPPLSHCPIVPPVAKWPRQNTSRTFYLGMKNGNIELGFHIKETDRLFRLTSSNSSSHAPYDRPLNDIEANNPDELLNLLISDPTSYSKCLLRIDSSAPQRRYFGLVPDSDSPDINIPGRVHGAYEDDLVVVETQEPGVVQPKNGFIKGILRRLIPSKERQFVCTVDKRNLGIMTPINKASPKLMNFTKTDEKNIIPIYKMDGTKVIKAVVLRGKRVKEALAGERVFVVKFLQWRNPFPHPLGLAVHHLSYGKDFETGMEILYEEYNIKKKFTDKALTSCISNSENWKIPAGEKARRKAYRTSVFTIDPPESRDLDDAMNMRVLDDGNYEVGIHIADVSYFVVQNTPLDEEALSRGTSYYPPKPHELVPMLPRELSEGCCSLLEGKDRLTVSVFVKLDGEANVVGEPRYERTIVRSCCKLTYHEAQEVIDEGMVDEGCVVEEESHVSKRGDGSNRLEIGNGLNEIKSGRSKEEQGDHLKVLGSELETEKYGNTLMKETKKAEDGQEIEMEDHIIGTENDMVTVEEKVVFTGNIGEIEKEKRSENGLQENGCVTDTKKKIPKKVKKAILVLHKLAVNRRKSRLKETYFYHRKDGEESKDNEAHEMVEEMMIMANHLVAKYLLTKFPQCTPLRVHLPPKTHRIQEWRSRFQKFARYSLGIKSLPNTDGEEQESEPDIMVPQSTWNNIMSALKLAAHSNSNFQELLKLICDVNQYPQLALAYSHQQRLQQRSNYACSYETESDFQRGHSGLELDSYCHFTSPIRRYIDVVVHRLLVRTMKNDNQKETGQEYEIYTANEITTICDRCTFLSRNCNRFEKDAKRLQLSVELQESTKFVNAMIEEVEDDRFKLFFGSGQLDLLQGSAKSVRIARLAPIENPKRDGDQMTVKWKFRILLLKKEDSSQPCENESTEGENTHNKDRSKEACQEKANVMLEFPGKKWRSLLEAVKNEDHECLKKCIKDVDQIAQQKHKKPVNRTTLYKHPNTGEEPSGVAETDGFLSVTKLIKPCDPVKVQLCSQVSRGILAPTIQLFQITEKMHVCLEHRNSPIKCFVKSSARNAFQTEYDDIENYISLRKPVLMMEITTSAVQEDDTITLFNLPVTFSRKEDNKLLCMEFEIPPTYDVNLLKLDLVCIRVNNPYNKEEQAGFWVSHFSITNYGKDKKEKKKADEKASCYVGTMIQSSCPIPDFVFEKICLVTAEIIHLNTPDRNHLGALTQCYVASDLVQNICIGIDPENEIDVDLMPAEDLSLSKMCPLIFKPLNKYQSNAVKEALTKPFTLIQGPPGTGKTVTGVHIAYWFAQINKTNDQTAVFYCGPSNKSVDVVARYLKKIPGLKILRMYSEEIEQKEFPVPNKVRAFRRKHLSAQLKVDEEIGDVCLHRVIRSERCPFATDLHEIDRVFKECIENREDASLKSLNEYRKTKSAAEQWAFHDDVDIILCTCTSAFSSRIKEEFGNRQCIVDECGMCIESETLCAILGSNATQVVLIGDHKQLQPVIKDDKAKDLGLGISMFERYSKKSLMLKRQYRMHQQICEFPSQYFYNGELETAKQVLDRDPDNLDLWPQGSKYPFMFYHTEGKEESLVVTTEQGNENSKRNEKEIHKIVYFTRTFVGSGISQNNILILSPYKAQCHYVKKELQKHGLGNVGVMTVVSSQGSEKDYVILSLVRSLPEKEIEINPSRSWLAENLGFVTDEHQINVALTRSKRGLCIIGNANLVRVCNVWKGLLEHYENNGSFLMDRDQDT